MKISELFESDWGKREFKRQELEWELRHEKDEGPGRREYHIAFDGKKWMDKTTGKPKVFHSRQTAEKAVATMMANPKNKGRRIEVV